MLNYIPHKLVPPHINLYGEQHRTIKHSTGLITSQEITYCTPEYLQNLVRNIFDDRKNNDHTLVVTFKEHTGQILKVQGCKITSWVQNHDDNTHNVQLDMDGHLFNVKLHDFTEVQILHSEPVKGNK